MSDELHIICISWKQSEPIEHLDPHKENSPRSYVLDSAFVEILHVVVDANEKHGHEDVVQHERNHINDVPDIEEVLVAALEELSQLNPTKEYHQQQ